MPVSSRTKGILLALSGTLLWGISGPVAQFLFQYKEFSPHWTVELRLLLAGVMLLIYTYFTASKGILAIWFSSDRKPLLIFSLFGALGIQYPFYLAIMYGNAASATLLQYTFPMIIMVYLALKLRRLPSQQEILSFLLALGGMFLIITGGSLSKLNLPPAGLFWGILSAFTAAFYNLYIKPMQQHWPTTLIMGWSMLLAGLCLVPFFPLPDFPGIWDTAAGLAFFYLVVFGTLLAFTLYSISIQYLRPAEVGIISAFEPLSAALLSALFLHLPFGLIEWSGTFFILFAIFLLTGRRRGSANTSRQADSAKDRQEG